MFVLSVRRLRITFAGLALLTVSGCSLMPKVEQNSTVAEVPPIAAAQESEREQSEPQEQQSAAAQCPQPEPNLWPPVEPRSCPKPVQCPLYLEGVATNSGNIAIIGQVEYVDVMSIPIRKKARIDTGAETSSIDATDIVEFERDGEKWVQFQVTDRSTDDVFEVKAPVVRSVLIKQHGVDNVRRQVVELDLRMGAIRETVEVTLADREKFDFPLLIGRNFLQGRAVVDVSRKYLTLNKESSSQTVLAQ